MARAASALMKKIPHRDFDPDVAALLFLGRSFATYHEDVIFQPGNQLVHGEHALRVHLNELVDHRIVAQLGRFRDDEAFGQRGFLEKLRVIQ